MPTASSPASRYPCTVVYGAPRNHARHPREQENGGTSASLPPVHQGAQNGSRVTETALSARIANDEGTPVHLRQKRERVDMCGGRGVLHISGCWNRPPRSPPPIPGLLHRHISMILISGVLIPSPHFIPGVPPASWGTGSQGVWLFFSHIIIIITEQGKGTSYFPARVTVYPSIYHRLGWGREVGNGAFWGGRRAQSVSTIHLAMQFSCVFHTSLWSEVCWGFSKPTEHFDGHTLFR